jgi:hypothetical protein
VFKHLIATYPNDFYSGLVVFVALLLVVAYLISVFFHMGMDIVNSNRLITRQLEALIKEQEQTRVTLEQQKDRSY